MPVELTRSRKLANLATAIDSASSGSILKKGTEQGEYVSVSLSDVSGVPSFLDSAVATTIIDSSYIQARQSGGGGTAFDSSTLTSLVDSNYITSRFSNGNSEFKLYRYNATAGQTTFQDSDRKGNILSYTVGGVKVFYNGVSLLDTEFTADDGSSVVLDSAASLNAKIQIAKWNVPSSGGGGAAAVWYGDRGLISGGQSSNVMDYIAIATPGNATDFGDLSVTRNWTASLGDGTYGVTSGGTTQKTTIDYVTIATTGNAADFGDTTQSKSYHATCCDGTYGIHAGGADNPGRDVIEYITVATPGNATDFGDINNDTSWGFLGGGLGNATYGVFAGGSNYTYSNVYIQYITVATPGNASTFGNLSAARAYISGVSDATRGVFSGDTNNNVIDYITIATPGNATDFGDMNWQDNSTAGMSDATYGVWGSGSTSDLSLDYITIQSPGNAADFGDLSVGRSKSGGCSGSSS